MMESYQSSFFALLFLSLWPKLGFELRSPELIVQSFGSSVPQSIFGVKGAGCMVSAYNQLADTDDDPFALQ